MANPFIGEIRIFAGNFNPRGWQLCNGQILPISSNTALFSLLGTYYGGNGTSNFGLPNLQNCAPMHWGQSTTGTTYVLGENAGSSAVTIITNEVPRHNHTYNSSSGTKGEVPAVTGNTNADERPGNNAYATASDNTVMNPGMLSSTPASQPHDNLQPYLGLTFIIATQGVFPARN